MLAISRRIVGSPAVAEDIVQDSFLKWHHADQADKLCRDLIRRFHNALSGADMPAMMMLLSGDQPMFVADSSQLQAPADDASYHLALAASATGQR